MKSIKELINGLFTSYRELDNIKKHPEKIKNIANPTEAQQLAAVKSSPHTIKYIKSPTERVQLIALKEDIYNYPYIKKLSEKSQLYLLKHGIEIQYIKNPTEKVQLYALRWKGVYSIADIKNPTEKVQFMAIKKSKEVFLEIKNPTIAVCKEIAKDLCGNIEIPTNRKIIKATKKLISELKYIEGDAYLKDMNIDYNKGNHYVNNESDKIKNWKIQKQREIIDNYKYEIGITTEKDIEPNIKNPWGALDKENISAESMDKWGIITNKYTQMKANRATNQVEFQSSGCKNLIGDVSYSSDQKQISNYHILDKSTGKIEPLHISGIDLGKQSPEAIKKLLSGQQVEISTKSGITQKIGLSKTPAGWGIQIGKQTFQAADSSVEI